MTDIIELQNDEKAPNDTDHIIIRRAGDSVYQANGSVVTANGAIFFKPPNFLTLEDAKQASVEWAEAHHVSTIYIKN